MSYLTPPLDEPSLVRCRCSHTSTMRPLHKGGLSCPHCANTCVPLCSAVARANVRHSPRSVQSACWRSAIAHRLPASLHRNASTTCGTEKIAMDSRPVPCVSVTAASASAPPTSWGATGSPSTAGGPHLPTASRLCSAWQKGPVCSLSPPPCPSVSPAPPSPAVGGACPQRLPDQCALARARAPGSTSPAVRALRSALAPCLMTPWRACASPGNPSATPPGSCPPRDALTHPWPPRPRPCAAAASRALAAKRPRGRASSTETSASLRSAMPLPPSCEQLASTSALVRVLGAMHTSQPPCSPSI
jgi:hypothetical protein